MAPVRLRDLFDRADAARLTELERDTIARSFAGETTAEIAAASGVTARAVRYRLESAARKLAILHEQLLAEREAAAG